MNSNFSCLKKEKVKIEDSLKSSFSKQIGKLYSIIATFVSRMFIELIVWLINKIFSIKPYDLFGNADIEDCIKASWKISRKQKNIVIFLIYKIQIILNNRKGNVKE